MKKAEKHAIIGMLAVILCTIFVVTVFASPITPSVEDAIDDYEEYLKSYIAQTPVPCVDMSLDESYENVMENYNSLPTLAMSIDSHNAFGIGPYSSLKITDDSVHIFSNTCDISFARDDLSELYERRENTVSIDGNSQISFVYKTTETGACEYIVFETAEAPHHISRDINVGNNCYIRGAFERQTENWDGSFLIKTDSGVPIGAIGAPLAFDAVGNRVDISVLFNDGTVTYELANQNQLEYPIVARVMYDAASDFFAYYTDGVWKPNYDPIYGRSLAIWPKSWRTTILSEAEREIRWIAVYNYYYMDTQWCNTSRMRDQFMCHAIYCPIKDEKEWNLEPLRPDVPATISNRCNPV